MVKKLVLINPMNPARVGLTFNKSSRFPPLGLGIIAALTPETWDVELIDESWEPFVYREADLVGITAFTASANRAYEIAQVYRAQGTPVVAGGIHVSACPEEALHYVDAVVIGEAEAVWAKVIEDVELGTIQEKYFGDWTDLNGLVKPRRDLFDPRYMFATIQTSRGCPMDCDFCSVTAFNGRRYRRRPPEEVLEELARIQQKMVFFVDDNIIGYGTKARQQALTIFKGMVEQKMNKWWFCQASLNFAEDDEVLYWAAKAGCKMVFIGLEAENDKALEETNKQMNLRISPDGYEGVFRRIQRYGIAVLGAFIFGMDSDSEEAIIRRANYIAGCGVDVIQTTMLTPLPGTRLFQRLQDEDRLLYREYPWDWDRYDMSEVLHKPSLMSPMRLQKAMDRANTILRSRKLILGKFVKTLMATRRLSTGMWALSSNLNYRKVNACEQKTRDRLYGVAK